MSHFTVLAVVTPERLERHRQDISDTEMSGDEKTFRAVQEAIAELLAPYQEYDGQDHLKEYLEFEDRTEDLQENVETVVEADGYMDETYPGYVGKTYGELYMDLWETQREQYVERILRCGYPEERLDDITAHDLVAMCYSGDTYREVDGEVKYGYYHNPQGNWDWWVLGGRWTGTLPIKEGCTGYLGRPGLGTSSPTEKNRVDCARICDLDIDVFETQTQRDIDQFWGEYQTYMKTGVDNSGHPLFGVHYKLMQMGIEVVNEDEHRKAVEHNRRVEDNGILKGRQNVVPLPEKEYGRTLTKEDLETELRWYFEWDTYAALDDDGWHSKGEMGWFGCSSDDLDDRENWSKSFFERFIHSRDPQSFVAVVDCHI